MVWQDVGRSSRFHHYSVFLFPGCTTQKNLENIQQRKSRNVGLPESHTNTLGRTLLTLPELPLHYNYIHIKMYGSSAITSKIITESGDCVGLKSTTDYRQSYFYLLCIMWVLKSPFISPSVPNPCTAGRMPGSRQITDITCSTSMCTKKAAVGPGGIFLSPAGWGTSWVVETWAAVVDSCIFTSAESCLAWLSLSYSCKTRWLAERRKKKIAAGVQEMDSCVHGKNGRCMKQRMYPESWHPSGTKWHLVFSAYFSQKKKRKKTTVAVWP